MNVPLLETALRVLEHRISFQNPRTEDVVLLERERTELSPSSLAGLAREVIYRELAKPEDLKSAAFSA